MNDKTCRSCKFHEKAQIEFKGFICNQNGDRFVFEEYEPCSDFKPKVEEPEVEEHPARHFHSWRKNTGAYSGAFTTHNGKTPAASYYDYEEYTPPSRPEPDGWYLVKIGADELLREKRGIKAYDRNSHITGNWSAYHMIAHFPEIIWLDGREGENA